MSEYLCRREFEYLEEHFALGKGDLDFLELKKSIDLANLYAQIKSPLECFCATISTFFAYRSDIVKLKNIKQLKVELKNQSKVRKTFGSGLHRPKILSYKGFYFLPSSILWLLRFSLWDEKNVLSSWLSKKEEGLSFQGFDRQDALIMNVNIFQSFIQSEGVKDFHKIKKNTCLTKGVDAVPLLIAQSCNLFAVYSDESLPSLFAFLDDIVIRLSRSFYAFLVKQDRAYLSEIVKQDAAFLLITFLSFIPILDEASRKNLKVILDEEVGGNIDFQTISEHFPKDVMQRFLRIAQHDMTDAAAPSLPADKPKPKAVRKPTTKVSVKPKFSWDDLLGEGSAYIKNPSEESVLLPDKNVLIRRVFKSDKLGGDALTDNVVSPKNRQYSKSSAAEIPFVDKHVYRISVEEWEYVSPIIVHIRNHFCKPSKERPPFHFAYTPMSKEADDAFDVFSVVSVSRIARVFASDADMQSWYDPSVRKKDKGRILCYFIPFEWKEKIENLKKTLASNSDVGWLGWDHG